MVRFMSRLRRGNEEGDAMTWEFDDDGEWTANSAIHDDGVPFVYRIRVHEEGTFHVEGSDSELVGDDERDGFKTLELAKKFCVGNDKDMIAENEDGDLTRGKRK